MKVISAVITAAMVSSTLGFLVANVGKCPKIPTKPDFDLQKYLGLWFSYEMFDAPYQWNTICVKALYSLNDAGNIRVINAGYRVIKLYNSILSKMTDRAVGEATVVDPNVPGGLRVSFGDMPDFDDGQANYLVIETDYNYAVVYSCFEFSVLKIETAWILTRLPGVAPANITGIKTNLESYGVDTSNFKRIDQSPESCIPNYNG